MQDEQLDIYITLALKSQTVVMQQQQTRAWLRLWRRVRITPRLVESRQQRSLSRRVLEGLWHSLKYLLLAEEIYERAARHRHIGIGLPMHSDLMLSYHPLQPYRLKAKYNA